jgi:PAS domain S-box-containing protein
VEERKDLRGLWKQVMISDADLPFVEMEVIAGGGEAINLEVMLGSMTWKGRPALFAIFRDITERTLMMAELTRYAEAFELLQDTVVLADGSFRIIYVNPAGLKRSGYSLDEVVDRPVDIFGAMRPGEEDTNELRSTFLEKGAWRGERWAVRKDGTEYPVDIIVTLQRDTEGIPQMVTLVSRDISLQKSNELSLMRARERAEFFRDLMSHDINNYIQGVIGRLELLAGTQLTDVQRSHIFQAMEQAKRTSDLVSRVRTISQARHGEELREVDLLSVVGEAIEDLRRKYKDIPFVVSIVPQHERVLVLADDLLKDLVINVLDNAIKHSVQPPGIVEVATRPTWEGRKRIWRLEISDHGPGIPDSDKEEIFFKYVRRGGNPEGSGLGLSLVMAIAERYNGRVWIEDRVPGDHTQGARVVVELPAA